MLYTVIGPINGQRTFLGTVTERQVLIVTQPSLVSETDQDEEEKHALPNYWQRQRLKRELNNQRDR